CALRAQAAELRTDRPARRAATRFRHAAALVRHGRLRSCCAAALAARLRAAAAAVSADDGASTSHLADQAIPSRQLESKAGPSDSRLRPLTATDRPLRLRPSSQEHSDNGTTCDGRRDALPACKREY